MKQSLFIMLMLLLSIEVNAQTWSEVKSRSDLYLYGEGKGESVEIADEKALYNLVSQISVTVTKEFTMSEEEKIATDGVEISSYAMSKMETYSNATLSDAWQIIVKDEPNAIVVRYIRREDVNKLFDGRKDRVIAFITSAIESENNMALDNALRYYSWASALLKTLPHPDDVTFTTSDGITHKALPTWISAQMDKILSGIRVKVDKQEGNDVDLFFTYKNKPVSSLDYTFNDGHSQSAIHRATDGRGVMELLPGVTLKNIKIKFEYNYLNQAKAYDKEVASALSIVMGGVRKSASFMLHMEGNSTSGNTSTTEKGQTKTVDEIVASVHIPSLGEVSTQQKQKCKETVGKVVTAIQSKNLESVSSLFTSDGYDIFKKLIKYGNARVLKQGELSFSKMDEQIVVRSVPMAFQFQNSSVKSFVEEVAFTINSDGKIDNITFGLGDEATADIMSRDWWSEGARMMIINFLEVYKTAYALKRLDYIKSIFDDNAVIIVGKMVKKANNSDADRYAMNKFVQRTRYTKEEYMKHLENNFNRNEFINIRFSRTNIEKAQKKEVYGIQIKQEYFSSTYGDSGYLYLQVDMTNPNAPLIIVRTWQDKFDPEVGLYGLNDF